MTDFDNPNDPNVAFIIGQLAAIEGLLFYVLSQQLTSLPSADRQRSLAALEKALCGPRPKTDDAATNALMSTDVALMTFEHSRRIMGDVRAAMARGFPNAGGASA